MDNKEKSPRKTPSVSKSIPINTLVEVAVDRIQGLPMSQIAKKHNVSTSFLTKRTGNLSEVMSSTSPTMEFERKIISDAISERLKPIKADLAVKSLEIIKKTDDIVAERLSDDPESIKTKDLISISDTYSRRLARLTGIEESPEEVDTGASRTKIVNSYVQNIFNSHNKELERERTEVNDTKPKVVIDVDID